MKSAGTYRMRITQCALNQPGNRKNAAGGVSPKMGIRSNFITTKMSPSLWNELQ